MERVNFPRSRELSVFLTLLLIQVLLVAQTDHSLFAQNEPIAPLQDQLPNVAPSVNSTLQGQMGQGQIGQGSGNTRSTLNIWQPPEFFSNPNINVSPLESDPRLNSLDLPNYQLFKRQLQQNRGFDYLLAYTPLVQFGEGGREFFDAELDFGFIKELADQGDSKTNLLMYMLWVQTFSADPTGAFAAPYGVSILPNSGGTDPNQGTIQLNLLALEKTWLDESISLRVGQLRNDFFFGTNKYHNDDRYVFINTVLSGLQGANWAASGKGLGAMLDLRGDQFYTTFGFSDAKGNQTYPDFSTFFDGRYHYLGEMGWTPKFGDNEGEYKITLSHTTRTGDSTDVGQRQGYGLILGGRQDFNKRIGLSFRWNKSFERFNSGLKESLATGLTFTGVGPYQDDWISLGWFWGEPIDPALQNENGMEIYWRAQLSKNIELTPDLLVYFDRANQQGTAYFGALRARFIY